MSQDVRMSFDEGLMNITVEKLRASQKEFDHMEETNVVTIEDKSTAAVQKNDIPSNIGLDIGTMNIVSAKNNENKINTTSFRNVFLKVDNNLLKTQEVSKISHTEIDGETYILSEDAYSFANIFGLELSRPMCKGMISNSEIDSIDVLSVMVSILVGEAKPNSVCCYSIPANPIDAEMNVLFHKSVFERIITDLKYKALPLSEAVALIYSECKDEKFSGVGISFGAGMTNVAVVFKGVEVLSFSMAIGGDWIDENAALQLQGIVKNRVTRIKESSDFDINNYTVGINKKERRIREALSHCYKHLIQYTIKCIETKLSELDIDFPSNLPVVVSGGTSMAKGFVQLLEQEIKKYNFPFAISAVRIASNPLTAVAEGCLVRSMLG